MDSICTPTFGQAYTPIAAFATVPANAPRVELASIIDEPSGRYVIFAAGRGQRIVRVAPEELATFAAFRCRVLEALNIEVGPPRLEWDFAVRAAVKRGVA